MRRAMVRRPWTKAVKIPAEVDRGNFNLRVTGVSQRSPGEH
jgi:hypothetical protein